MKRPFPNLEIFVGDWVATHNEPSDERLKWFLTFGRAFLGKWYEMGPTEAVGRGQAAAAETARIRKVLSAGAREWVNATQQEDRDEIRNRTINQLPKGYRAMALKQFDETVVGMYKAQGKRQFQGAIYEALQGME